MQDPDRRPFAVVTERLVEAARGADGVAGLVLLGSAADSGGARRDEHSDHDFYAVLEPGAEAAARAALDFVPDRDRVVLIARDGDGASVLYDDGHLLEFGAGSAAELGPVRLRRAQVVLGGDEVQDFARDGDRRGAAPAAGTTADAVGLALVKLLIGAGRAARGETVSGGVFVRAHAVAALAAAVRLTDGEDDAADPFDPLRRLERHDPDLARRIEAAVARPVPEAAAALLALIRERFDAPGAGFPQRAAAIVERAVHRAADRG